MKKILFSLLTILLFTACQKQISTDKVSEELGNVAAKGSTKIQVCHYDALTGKSHTILVNASSLPEHLAQGDVLGDCSAVITTICSKDWMVKNLDVSTYRNGDQIPQVTDLSTWHELTTGAWCYYNNDPANGAIYGKLYNWYAVNDPRGLTPPGWHVPTDAEWFTLQNCLTYDLAGGAMKETGTTHWLSPNTGAINSSGFTGLPSGYVYDYDTYSVFQGIGREGVWWSSTEYNTYYANFWYLYYASSYLNFFTEKKQDGFSVRCARD